MKVTVASSTNVSSLPSVPRTRSAVWGSGGTYVLLQRLPPKGKPLLPLPRETALASSFTLAFFVHRVDEFHDATQSFRRQARRNPLGPTAVRTEGSKFCQKYTLALCCGPGAHKLLHHGCIVVGDVVVEVAALAREGL